MSEKSPIYDMLNDNEAKKKMLEMSGELSRLADTAEGRSIREQFAPESAAIQAALAGGDTGALKDIASKMLSTEEGARLARALEELLK